MRRRSGNRFPNQSERQKSNARPWKDPAARRTTWRSNQAGPKLKWKLRKRAGLRHSLLTLSLEKKQSIPGVIERIESIDFAWRFRNDIRRVHAVLKHVERNHGVANLHPVHIVLRRTRFSLENTRRHI